MPPEAIQHEQIDARSDLYALGAVGYFLITGTPVFDGESVLRILQQHVAETPEAPSKRLGGPVSAAFEAVLMKCLAKLPGDRPARVGTGRIARSVPDGGGSWTRKDAERWWQEHGVSRGKPTTQPETKKHFAATQMFGSTEAAAAKEV